MVFFISFLNTVQFIGHLSWFKYRYQLWIWLNDITPANHSGKHPLLRRHIMELRYSSFLLFLEFHRIPSPLQLYLHLTQVALPGGEWLLRNIGSYPRSAVRPKMTLDKNSGSTHSLFRTKTRKMVSSARTFWRFCGRLCGHLEAYILYTWYLSRGLRTDRWRKSLQQNHKG